MQKLKKFKIEKAKPTDYGEEVEKDGVDTGLKAVNPFSGEELPVWVGNYVMMEYGTGAVMSVPAHDERDFEFAKKFDLPIREVVSSLKSQVSTLKSAESQQLITNQESKIEEAFTDYGVLMNSGEWSGKTSEDAKKRDGKVCRREEFWRISRNVSPARLGNFASEVLGRAASDCLLRNLRNCACSLQQIACRIARICAVHRCWGITSGESF